MANDKLRATAHTGRTRSDGTAYSVKHNDRNYDLRKSTNVNPELVDKNLYVIINVDGTIDKQHSITFDEHEHNVYQSLFSQSLDAQNQRHIDKRNFNRVRTIDDYRSAPRSCPEEVIMQIGTKDDRDKITRGTLARALNGWLSDMQQKYGSNVHLLDVAIHVDEPGGIHAHVRWVYSKHGKDGLEVSESGALSELGIERPNLDVPSGKYNNSKMTFTQDFRNMWIARIQEAGIDIDTVPEEPGKATLTKEEYIANKAIKEAMSLDEECQTLTAARNQLIQETEKLASEREQLQQEVEALQAEKAVYSALQSASNRLV